MKPATGPRKHPKLVLFWKIVSMTAGSILILVGIVGLFLPVLQGWVMILGGLALLSPHSRWAHAILTWLKARLSALKNMRRSSPPVGIEKGTGVDAPGPKEGA